MIGPVPILAYRIRIRNNFLPYRLSEYWYLFFYHKNYKTRADDEIKFLSKRPPNLKNDGEKIKFSN